MRKLIALLPILVILLAAPVVLAHNNDDSTLFNAKIEIIGNNTGCSDDVKNHGEFVSCEAKLDKDGHGNSLSARSDIGKKQHDRDEDEDEDDDDFTASPTPSASPTASPSPSVSPSPEASPSPDVSPSPSASPLTNVRVNLEARGPIDQVIAFIESIINTLKNLV